MDNLGFVLAGYVITAISLAAYALRLKRRARRAARAARLAPKR